MLPASTMLIMARGFSSRMKRRETSSSEVLMAPDHPVLAVHGDPWEIADMLVSSGELVEQGGLAAVLVASKGERQHSALRERVLVFP